MKKIISAVFVGAIGGAVALFTNHYFFNHVSASSQINYNPYQAPVHYTSYNGSTMNAAPDFVASAEKSVNSVVHIKTTSEGKANVNYDPFQQWFYGQRQPYVLQGSGSGVIISADGYIVTNNHVVADADKIEVVLNDKRSYTGEVIGTDPNTDLALIKIKETDLPFITYGNSDNVKVGEWALAVGNPFNLNSTVTAGIISAKGRNINILEGSANANGGGVAPIESFIQTDAAVNPGNSGGALVNNTGELIGINTAIASNNGSYQGYSFAIPVNIVKKVVSDLVEFGTVQRAFIGVSIQDIDAKFAQQKNIKQLRGAYVNGLTVNGAGEEAGIKIGDIITKVEGVAVKGTSELLEQIGKFRPSDKITVTVIREDKELLLPVVLKNKENSLGVIKKAEVARTSINALGATFEELSSEDLSKLKITNGVKVSKLSQGKLASAGIREGFVITSIDKKKMSSVKDIQANLENKSGGVLIEGVYANGTRAFYGFGM